MKPDVTLYLVTDSRGIDCTEFLKRIEAACRGGAALVQLREKNRCSRDLLALAKQVKLVTDKFHVPLIINDRADIALACGAAGVHGGSEDIPIADLRRIMGENSIIGATAKSLPQALQAQADGADYLGVGAIFPTATKDAVLTDIDMLRNICAKVSVPVCAIGGITAENCGVLSGSGISGLAVVSAIMSADDSEAAASELLRKAREIIS